MTPTSVWPMAQDNPLLGILLMIGFCVVAPMGDAVAKLLGESQPLGQMLIIRFAVQCVLLLPLVAVTGRAWRLSGRLLRLATLRTGLHILGIGMMFTALRYLPLADAVAIAFVMPFILLILGRYILGEEVGMRRLAACVIGFIGTLMVIQPSFAEVGLPALLPLGLHHGDPPARAAHGSDRAADGLGGDRDPDSGPRGAADAASRSSDHRFRADPG